MSNLKIIAQDESLFDSIVLRGKETKLTIEILNKVKKPTKAKELEKMYGSSTVYNLLRKLEKAGMIEKTDKGYIISKKFSSILRTWAEEWDKFVEE